MLRSLWNPPRSGSQPVSPALAGRFLSTVPPGKSLNLHRVEGIISVQFSSVAQSCLTLCNPMDCSTPGFPVNHHLPEFTQTHVHHVSDAIQPSHPLSFPSPPTFNLSSIRVFFPMSQFSASGGQSIGVSASTSVFPKNIQD